ncbi:hypothetical protein BH09MYX1_BH09MYX1_68050 [soil metagenome]
MKHSWAVAMTVFVVTLGACADDGSRPTTAREWCEETGVIRCAIDSLRDACDERAVTSETTCRTGFVVECCAFVGDCEQGFQTEIATYREFAECRAAIDELSCADSRTKPAECVGVVK